MRVRRSNDRVMSLAVVLEEVVRVVCTCASQSIKTDGRKDDFYEDLPREWTIHHMSKMIICIGDFNRHIG